MNIAILGRESNLCRAELETIFTNTKHIDKHISLYEDSHDISIDRLGGLVKTGQIIISKPLDELRKNPNLIPELLKDYILKQKLTRKVSYGISVYGDKSKACSIVGSKVGLELKNLLKTEGISSRYINAKNTQNLSSAQITYNNLVGPRSKGFDFISITSGEKLILGITKAVQDINSYTKRDRQRPCRDMVVGMLPPKLAQIMINLASPAPDQIVVDPFCGSGVILQEALLMDLAVNGSDISSGMIGCANKNLTWLKQNYSLSKDFSLAESDATKLRDLPANCIIVSEGYLGQPLKNELTADSQQKLIKELSSLYIKFFKKLVQIKNKPSKVVICLPVWRSKSEILTLGIIDQIRELGYTLEQFDSQNNQELIYIRDNQIVGRQVLVLIRKVA